MNRERLEWHLENWSRWHSFDDLHKLGYPSKCMVLSTGGASGEDAFDILVEQVDKRCAEIMESLVESLRRPRKVAIEHVWLKVKHHYPTQELDYEEAIVDLLRLAEKRGIY